MSRSQVCHLFIWSSLQLGRPHKAILKVIYIKLGPSSCKSKAWDQTESKVITGGQALNQRARHTRQKEQHTTETAQQSPVHHRLSAALVPAEMWALPHSLQLKWMGWTSNTWIPVILNAAAWGALTWRASATKSAWRNPVDAGVLLQQLSTRWPSIHHPIRLDSRLQKNLSE